MKKRNESPKGAKFSRSSSPDRERKNSPRAASDRPARSGGPRPRINEAGNDRIFKPKKKITEKLFNKPTIKKANLEKLAFDSSTGRNPFRDDRAPRRDDRDFDKPKGEFRPRRDAGDARPPRRDDRDFDKPKGEFRPRRETGDVRPPRRDDRAPRRDDRDFDKPKGEFRPRRDAGDVRPPRRDDRAPRRDDRDFDKPKGEFRPRRDAGDVRPPRRDDRAPRRDDRDFDKPKGEFRPRRETGDVRPPRRDERDERGPRRENRGQDTKKDVASEAENRRVGRFTRPPRYDFSDYEDRKPRVKKQTDDDVLRLNRYIANAGICSRREADELIESGQISVNGKVVTEMGYKVKRSDTVKYGKKTLNPERMVYVLVNKPKDYITTTDDPEERKTVMDLVAGACEERIYPVGRLDRNTTGLLLLTNDGELAEKLTHPSGNVRKIYQAELDKPISMEDFEAMKEGFELEDGFIKPDEIGIVTPDAMVVGLEIHSGKNRIVRRMFEHFGYEVQKLDRTVFASLNKKELPRGKWRFLTEKEVIKLKFMQ